MRFLYNLFIQLYALAISLAALWNRKAAQWKEGRKNQWTELEATFSNAHAVIWIHAASAGEFEQAKPVIAAFKEKYPTYKVLVTAFSPSGYPTMKKFQQADYVFYLPLDTAWNAKKFLNIVQPKLVVFVKYDFWYHHLKAVHDRGIPLLLISALFRPDQLFFKPYGGFYRNLLHFFTHLFVQDETAYGLLKKAGFENSSVAGDTRFDRVLAIANIAEPIPFVDAFCAGKKIIVAGSTWPEDEALLRAAVAKMEGVKLILAPHEINPSHLKSIGQLFQTPIFYSSLQQNTAQLQNASVLVIDNMGMLSRLYRYGTVAYIGGGFNKSGIHNTLEAAVFGKPVLFGPNYQKFREARELLACGAAYSYSTEQELENGLKRWLTNAEVLEKSGEAARDYVQQNSGATETILQFIQEKRLLTN